MLFLQVLTLLLGALLYQQVAQLQMETVLIAKNPAYHSASETSPTRAPIVWNEKASVEKAYKDYYEFVVMKRPWLLVLDRLVWGFCFLFPAYLLIRKLADIEVADLGEALGGKTLLTGVLVGFATYCFINVLGGLFFFFAGKPQPTYLEAFLAENLRGNWNLLVWVLVSVSLGAGFFEEVFFRGFLLKYFFEENYPYVGLAVTSIIFGAIHFSAERSMIGPILLVFVGFTFGLSYLKTGNIWVPITAHASYNGSMLFATYFLGNRII